MSEMSQKRIEQLEQENESLRETIRSQELFIRQAMGSYVSTEVADAILAQRETIAIEGERRTVSILFADIRQSTELSELMEPTEYIRLLDHYLDDMIKIIDAWQGNILDFMGDAIIAVFGAPKENEDAARDALFCAVAMQRRMPAINEWNDAKGYPSISMGIGVHTGEAIVGTIGSETRMKYDVIGRNVNLTARIQGFAHGGQILATDEAVEAVGSEVIEREDGARWVEPKGIADNVLVHDVIGVGSLLILDER